MVKKNGDNIKVNIIRVAAQRYDDIGQLKTKYLHSDDGASYGQQLAHQFTPRGWLKKVEGQVGGGGNFGRELRYSDPSGGSAQFNGNIAEMLWKRGGINWVVYRFSYDRANRLTSSGGLATTPTGNMTSITMLMGI